MSSGRTHYKYGKRQTPMLFTEFQKKLEQGQYEKPRHKALIILLYHTGLRISEALKLRRESFTITPKILYVEVGKRLKGSKSTPPLELPLNLPYVSFLIENVKDSARGMRVFPYDRKTGYLIVKRVFPKEYPHFFRLNLITDMLGTEGMTIMDVRSWTGLSLVSLEKYAGFVSVRKASELRSQKIMKEINGVVGSEPTRVASTVSQGR